MASGGVSCIAAPESHVKRWLLAREENTGRQAPSRSPQKQLRHGGPMHRGVPWQKRGWRRCWSRVWSGPGLLVSSVNIAPCSFPSAAPRPPVQWPAQRPQLTACINRGLTTTAIPQKYGVILRQNYSTFPILSTLLSAVPLEWFQAPPLFKLRQGAPGVASNWPRLLCASLHPGRRHDNLVLSSPVLHRGWHLGFRCKDHLGEENGCPRCKD